MKSRHLQRIQPHWDWRAAANFVCGGAGAGLVIVTLLCALDRPEARVLIALGLALVALGLFAVWLELGRPLRAANVLLHLKGSWMSREALAALLLFPLGFAVLLGVHWAVAPAVVAAAAFLYCQVRILGSAMAIPAWREPWTQPLLMVTGITEGLGLFWLVGAWTQPSPALAVVLAILLIVRWLLWRVWRERLQRTDGAALALRALEPAGLFLQWLGALVPSVLALVAASTALPPFASAVLLATAGALAAFTGGRFKFDLITRAGFHHGIVLSRMPVRGVPRTAA